MNANQRTANANSGELAFFLQEKGLCEEFVKWYDEMAPIDRLLAKKPCARQANDLLQEGKKRGYEPSFVASCLDAMKNKERKSFKKSNSSRSSGD